MKRETVARWRERERQRAETHQEALRQQAEALETKRSHHRQTVAAAALALFLLLLGAAIAVLLHLAIADARDSIVGALQRPPSLSPQPPPEPSVGVPVMPDFGVSAYTAFGLFAACGLLALAFFVAPRLLDPGKTKDQLEYWAKVASVVSVVVAVIFGVVATLQAQVQIARATPTSSGTGDVLVAVHPPLAASAFVEVARVGPFAPAEPTTAELAPSSRLTPVVCDARRRLHQTGATSLLVVGRHDRQSYNKRTPADSNSALAQRRAEAVAKYLRDGPCDSAGLNLTVITVLGGPRVSGLPTGSDPSDREVVIYAVSTRGLPR
ncbi:MAG: hypothetical protein ACREXS_11140 [Gammaproteobacteria bacterium]